MDDGRCMLRRQDACCSTERWRTRPWQAVARSVAGIGMVVWSGLVSLGGPATGGWRGAVGLAVAPVCSARHHGMCAPIPCLPTEPLVLALPHVGLATLIIHLLLMPAASGFGMPLLLGWEH